MRVPADNYSGGIVKVQARRDNDCSVTHTFIGIS
jgi:hypothetical protein